MLVSYNGGERMPEAECCAMEENTLCEVNMYKSYYVGDHAR